MQPDLLAAATADGPPVPAGGVRHAVLFTPTFHSEALVSVDLAPGGGAVRLRSFDDSL